jgi:cysteine synthase A
LSDATLGMNGSNELASKISKDNNYFEINQFTSMYNQEAHFETMKEILNDLQDVDYIICGIGSAGTISGLSRYIKEHNLNIKVIGIEPDESAIITKGIKGEHAIQGIGAGFVPPLLNLDNIYKIECVKSRDVLEEFKNKKEISLGLSSCACYLVGKKILKKEPNKKILIIVADGRDRYGGVN